MLQSILTRVGLSWCVKRITNQWFSPFLSASLVMCLLRRYHCAVEQHWNRMDRCSKWLRMQVVTGLESFHMYTQLWACWHNTYYLHVAEVAWWSHSYLYELPSIQWLLYLLVFCMCLRDVHMKNVYHISTIVQKSTQAQHFSRCNRI